MTSSKTFYVTFLSECIYAAMADIEAKWEGEFMFGDEYHNYETIMAAKNATKKNQKRNKEKVIKLKPRFTFNSEMSAVINRLFNVRQEIPNVTFGVETETLDTIIEKFDDCVTDSKIAQFLRFSKNIIFNGDQCNLRDHTDNTNFFSAYIQPFITCEYLMDVSVKKNVCEIISVSFIHAIKFMAIQFANYIWYLSMPLSIKVVIMVLSNMCFSIDILQDLHVELPNLVKKRIIKIFNRKNGVVNKKSKVTNESDEENKPVKKRGTNKNDSNDENKPAKKGRPKKNDSNEENKPAKKGRTKKNDSNEKNKSAKKEKSKENDSDDENKPAKKGRVKKNDSDDENKSVKKEKSKKNDSDDENKPAKKGKSKTKISNDENKIVKKGKAKLNDSDDENDEVEMSQKKIKKKVKIDESSLKVVEENGEKKTLMRRKEQIMSELSEDKTDDEYITAAETHSDDENEKNNLENGNCYSHELEESESDNISEDEH